MHLSASTIMHDNIRNASGEDLGKIEDLMVDVGTGNIEYAVVSFGGFLSIGDKYFAIPLEAMRLDTDKECLVLDEPKERLENAPGFDKDHWPNHAEPKWRQTVRSYYNLEPRT